MPIYMYMYMYMYINIHIGLRKIFIVLVKHTVYNVPSPVLYACKYPSHSFLFMSNFSFIIELQYNHVIKLHIYTILCTNS